MVSDFLKHNYMTSDCLGKMKPNCFLSVILTTLLSCIGTHRPVAQESSDFLLDLTTQSSLVVDGAVVGYKNMYDDSGRIYSSMQLLVRSTLSKRSKVKRGDTIKIFRWGGIIGSDNQSVEHQASINLNERGIFFLKKSPESKGDYSFTHNNVPCLVYDLVDSHDVEYFIASPYYPESLGFKSDQEFKSAFENNPSLRYGKKRTRSTRKYLSSHW